MPISFLVNDSDYLVTILYNDESEMNRIQEFKNEMAVATEVFGTREEILLTPRKQDQKELPRATVHKRDSS